MAVPVPLPAYKPLRTSWKLILYLSQVSMITFTTFNSVSIRPTPRVLVFPLGMRNNIVHPRSVGIYPFCHMYSISPTRFFPGYGFGGVDDPSAAYAYHSHFLKCLTRRWVCPPALFSHSILNSS